MLVLARKNFGHASTRRRSTSYSAKASFTLVCDLTPSAGKSATAQNTSPEPGIPRTTPAQLVEGASVASVLERGRCAASYCKAPFLRERTSSQSPISKGSPLLDSILPLLFVNCLVHMVYIEAGGEYGDLRAGTVSLGHETR